MSRRGFWICLVGLLLSVAGGLLFMHLQQERLQRQYKTVIVGSKEFAESVLLGEIIAGLARDAGADAVRHLPHAGGTGVVFHALVSGQIDIYVEYTGTLLREIYPDDKLETVKEHLQEAGLRVSNNLGFNNSYAIAVKREIADEFRERTGRPLRSLSDLAELSEDRLRIGLSEEFITRRKDGYRDLKQRYRLPDFRPIPMSHDQVYDALRCGIVEAADVYTTDAELEVYKESLVVLADDAKPPFFPRYEAMLLFREDLFDRAPEVMAALSRLVSALSEDEMRRLASKSLVAEEHDCGEVEKEILAAGDGAATQTVKLLQDLPEGKDDPMDRLDLAAGRAGIGSLALSDPERFELDRERLARMHADVDKLRRAAQGFLADELGVEARDDWDYSWQNIKTNTYDHLALIGLSLTPAIFLGLLLGALAARSRLAAALILLLVTVLWLIPPPAFLGLMRYLGLTYPLLGTGAPAAVAVIFLLTLYPVTLNAHQAFSGRRGGGSGDGGPGKPRLLLDGIYTATLFAVGVAILGTLVDAGGYGGPIRAAIQLSDPRIAPLGAIPSMVMAAAVCLLYWLARFWLWLTSRQRPAGTGSEEG